jgi:hypothetical protein
MKTSERMLALVSRLEVLAADDHITAAQLRAYVSVEANRLRSLAPDVGALEAACSAALSAVATPQ